CQNEEEILTEISKLMGNIASLNLLDNIEDLIDTHEQIKNLPKQWDIRKKIENVNQILKNLRELQLPNCMNISVIYPIQKGGFALALINKEICLVQILAIYYHTLTRNNYSYTEESISDINLVTFISTK
ncbi:35300_t:CDS:2, partial [Racocetra persica]